MISIITLALLLCASAQGKIESYRNVLSGESPLTQDIINSLYQDYKAEFKDSQVQNFLAQRKGDRKSIFEANIRDIIAHNSAGAHTWQKGLNAFSEMTDEEFMQYYNIVKKDQICTVAPPEGTKQSGLKANLPDRWDWRDFGVVTPPKNQGQCGSCWTFSTAGVMESHYLLKYGGAARNLSEQQLVDCAGGFDTYGCKGGLPSHSYEYIKYIGGLATEASYPYKAVDQPCAFKPEMASVTVVGGSVNITQNEVDIAVALFQNGPTSISFTVIPGFKQYSGGVYSNATCPNGPLDVNHDVMLIGYGTEMGVDYWLIKNSWGANWGDKGYFKIQRGVNMCGIVNCGSYPQDILDVAKAVPEVEPRKIYQQTFLEARRE